MKNATTMMRVLAWAAGCALCLFVAVEWLSAADVTVRLFMPYDDVSRVLTEAGAREVDLTVVGEPETVNWNHTFLLPEGGILLVGVDKKSGVVQRLLFSPNPDLTRGMQIGEMKHMDSISLKSSSPGYGK